MSTSSNFSRRLVITNEFLHSNMLRNPEILQRFPFMKSVANMLAPVDCPPCQQKNYPDVGPALTDLRRQISQMGPEDRQALKQLLGSDRVRVYVKDGQNASKPYEL